ncbi:cupin domain-containing protein [Radicibacter daui]|uniref:cupin domain-containing protein n=1 Tax=Radicibacter daui TaxID=3064829 RepID=UPI004046F07D
MSSSADPAALPPVMTLRRPGEHIVSSPEGIASAPFRVEPLFESVREGEMTAMRASLDPGTVTRWHSHPAGQFLLAVSGLGRVQKSGGPIETLQPGDLVWFAPGERHWHGASEAMPFTYVSIQPVAGGRVVDWLEPVDLSGSATGHHQGSAG